MKLAEDNKTSRELSKPIPASLAICPILMFLKKMTILKLLYLSFSVPNIEAKNSAILNNMKINGGKREWHVM